MNAKTTKTREGLIDLLEKNYYGAKDTSKDFDDVSDLLR